MHSGQQLGLLVGAVVARARYHINKLPAVLSILHLFPILFELKTRRDFSTSIKQEEVPFLEQEKKKKIPVHLEPTLVPVFPKMFEGLCRPLQRGAHEGRAHQDAKNFETERSADTPGRATPPFFSDDTDPFIHVMNVKKKKQNGHISSELRISYFADSSVAAGLLPAT